MKKPAKRSHLRLFAAAGYNSVLSGMVELLEAARRGSARTVNAIMTATYWEMGRRIVECEQAGRKRAGYGESLLQRLSADLTGRFGKGFAKSNLFLMRKFYLTVRPIFQTPSGKSVTAADGPIFQTVCGISPASGGSAKRSAPTDLGTLARGFPLPWSHYVLLISSSRSAEALDFYHTEALRGGWSVRQLRRQMGTQFYERTALSRNKVAMLAHGQKPRAGDAMTAEEEIKDPLVLEFLGLKDEYSETDLEEALVRHLESFLLELGNELAFVGRQKRLRIDHEWFRIDLLFFHRRLRSLVVIDLKTGPLVHADVGQMHLYLNYARANWVQPGENPPIGLILCTEQGESLARYALEGLPNKMLVREYKTALPSEKLLAAEIAKARTVLEGRKGRVRGGRPGRSSNWVK